ncbi:peptide chain release factor N(5)-glutamine methyltransferase [Candidatus Methylobacter oryzae]|uniref:Release factor glutamine methyltransferase n=1 Tax=Candidatus Methylobacter oryzae TaxID=2497749 RepID=A0ABY3CFA7_9GAMM|nr:peptide chain release factor N(5)-glutamine methyltransferase [Candidatus Methylobacter oryzae]TRX02312.1 peptide chain release factor N(5)-glutamine methyltransferase [Candidatus Methylobacter oryzae]
MQRIKSVLRDAADALALVSDSALLDAEILLCLALNKPRSHLRAWPDKPLQPEHLNAFKALLEQRKNGVPIAYITGNREFWSRDFLVTPDVLIPRPDTELLIELSLKLIPTDKPFKIIDLGTGSGIISITLAAERPLAQLSATDFSPAALRIAQLNAEKHHIDNIKFYLSDWFADIPSTKFNLIISNPPYIAEDDEHLQQGDVRFEPRTALSAKEQGLGDIKIIANAARNHLEPYGHLLIEHGYNQLQQVQTLFKNLHYDKVQTYTDLSGQPRVTYGQFTPNDSD